MILTPILFNLPWIKHIISIIYVNYDNYLIVSMEIVPDQNCQLIDDGWTREIRSDYSWFATVDEDNGVNEQLLGVNLRGTYTDYTNMMIADH